MNRKNLIIGVLSVFGGTFSVLKCYLTYRKVIGNKNENSIDTEKKQDFQQSLEVVESHECKKKSYDVEPPVSSTLRYYEGIVKVGHADSRNFYLLKNIYIKASSRKEAAKVLKAFPRVKHDDPKCILALKEISFNEYCQGCERNLKDNFFNCTTIQQQRVLCPEVFDERIPEDEKILYRKGRHSLRRSFFDDNDYKRMTLQEALA